MFQVIVKDPSMITDVTLHLIVTKSIPSMSLVLSVRRSPVLWWRYWINIKWSGCQRPLCKWFIIMQYKGRYYYYVKLRLPYTFKAALFRHVYILTNSPLSFRTRLKSDTRALFSASGYFQHSWSFFSGPHCSCGSFKCEYSITSSA